MIVLLPSGVAVALIVTLAGAVKVAPLAGLVIVSCGCVGDTTLSATGSELPTTPSEVVAFAVSTWLGSDAMTLFH